VVHDHVIIIYYEHMKAGVPIIFYLFLGLTLPKQSTKVYF
jgi:hypothetical protein